MWGDAGGGVWRWGAISKVCLHFACVKTDITTLLALGGWFASLRSDTVSADKELKIFL